MALHLVTGYKGTPHITAEDVGSFNAGILGSGEYVMNLGNKFAASLTTSNTVRILDGELMLQGRHVSLKKNTYEELTINNGEAGKNRNDLIVVRYTKDGTTGEENAVFAVIQGISTEGTATDPEYTTGDLLSGDCLLHEMPLYRITLTGLTVGEPEALFEVMKNSLGGLAGLLSKGEIPFLSADEDIASFWRSAGDGVWKVPNGTLVQHSQSEVQGTLINTVSPTGKVVQLFMEGGTDSSDRLWFRSSYAASDKWASTASHVSGWREIVTGKYVKIDCYVGTGAYGKDNPNLLTFEFSPKFLIVMRTTEHMFLHKFQEKSYYCNLSDDTQKSNMVTINGMKVEWYSTDSAAAQANSSGVYYFYIALG